MSRVARRYGARPEIFRNVAWRTLVEFVVDGDEVQRRKFHSRANRSLARDNPRAVFGVEAHYPELQITKTNGPLT
jgi:hypothetical protein